MLGARQARCGWLSGGGRRSSTILNHLADQYGPQPSVEYFRQLAGGAPGTDERHQLTALYATCLHGSNCNRLGRFACVSSEVVGSQPGTKSIGLHRVLLGVPRRSIRLPPPFLLGSQCGFGRS